MDAAFGIRPPDGVQRPPPIGWLLLAIGLSDAIYLPAVFLAMHRLLNGASTLHAWVSEPTGTRRLLRATLAIRMSLDASYSASMRTPRSLAVPLCLAALTVLNGDWHYSSK